MSPSFARFSVVKNTLADYITSLLPSSPDVVSWDHAMPLSPSQLEWKQSIFPVPKTSDFSSDGLLSSDKDLRCRQTPSRYLIRGRCVPETVGCFIEKCFLIADDVGMSDASQYSNLIEGVLLFLIGQVAQLYSLQSILRIIDKPFDSIDAGIGTLTQLLKHLKFLNGHLR